MAAGDGGPKRRDSLPTLAGPSDSGADPSAPEANPSEALAEISRTHHAALVRFLSVRTGSVEDAKDILQEAYVKMLALDRLGTVGFLGGYLWRTAVNLAVDRRRRRVLDESYRAAALPFAETRVVSAESTAETQQRLAIVERAIGELPPRCLEAFVLHVLKCLTFDEVGREMRISTRMAKKHVARALEYLQFRLDDGDGARSTQ